MCGAAHVEAHRAAVRPSTRPLRVWLAAEGVTLGDGALETLSQVRAQVGAEVLKLPVGVQGKRACPAAGDQSCLACWPRQ